MSRERNHVNYKHKMTNTVSELLVSFLLIYSSKKVQIKTKTKSVLFTTLDPSIKFHSNPFITFNNLIMLLTDRQTNRQTNVIENIASFAKEVKILKQLSKMYTRCKKGIVVSSYLYQCAAQDERTGSC